MGAEGSGEEFDIHDGEEVMLKAFLYIYLVTIIHRIECSQRC